MPITKPKIKIFPIIFGGTLVFLSISSGLIVTFKSDSIDDGSALISDQNTPIPTLITDTLAPGVTFSPTSSITETGLIVPTDTTGSSPIPIFTTPPVFSGPTNTPFPGMPTTVPTAIINPTATPKITTPTNTPRPGSTNTPIPPTSTPRPPTNTPVPPTSTPRPTATPVPSTTYRNGTYSTTGSYNTPAGPQQIGIQMTISNDNVTAIVVTNMANDSESSSYENKFKSGVGVKVVGFPLNNATSISKVNGASLTTNYFKNTAVPAIKSQAL